MVDEQMLRRVIRGAMLQRPIIQMMMSFSLPVQHCMGFGLIGDLLPSLRTSPYRKELRNQGHDH